MNDSNKNLAVLGELKATEWGTRFGLIVYSFGIFILSSGILYGLRALDIVLSAKLTVIILAGIQIVHLILWAIKRSWFFDPEALSMAFAISTEENSREYYREIKKQFKQQIFSKNLGRFVRVRELPSDMKFETSEVAEAFIIKKGIRVLIWGDTTEAKLNNAPFTQFNIKLSYQHGIVDSVRRTKFLADIGTAIQRKSWGVWKPHSYFGLVVVAGNVLEISLFTLGMCLASIPNFSYLTKSVDVLEDLNNILQNRKQDANFPNLDFVKQKVRSVLRDAYNLLMGFYWETKKNIGKAIEYGEKAIKLDENNFIAHQNMAVFRWLNNEQEKARYHTKRAWRIRPGHPLPRFNMAFFNFYDRKFEQGLRRYKKIKDETATNVVDVVEFLEREYEKVPDNLGLLFASGWLNVKFVDQLRGIDKLKEFLSKSKGNGEYALLTEEAQKVLNSITIAQAKNPL